MPHIHNQPGQHDICVSGYIVKITESAEPRIILHKHRKLNKLLQFWRACRAGRDTVASGLTGNSRRIWLRQKPAEVVATALQ